MTTASAEAGRPDRLYFMGVSGIAMGTLACMLKDEGYDVVGSDTNVYPPMSTFLEQKGIPVLVGWNPRNLEDTRPDAVIVGNVIRKDNPEVIQTQALGVPLLSMPQALDRFFLHSRKSVVVCGTHGKTTTTGLLGWLLESADLDPTVFVGGFVKGWGRSYRLGRGPYMVLEGDEYDTAFFDKQPKFLRYKPWVAVVTSIEFDHADIYRDVEHVTEAFRALSRIIPEDGVLIVNGDDPRCVEVARLCRGRVVTYGTSDRCLWRMEDFVASGGHDPPPRGLPGRGIPSVVFTPPGASQRLECRRRSGGLPPLGGAHGAASVSHGSFQWHEKTPGNHPSGRRPPCPGRFRTPPHRRPRDAQGDPSFSSGAPPRGGFRAADQLQPTPLLPKKIC